MIFTTDLQTVNSLLELIYFLNILDRLILTSSIFWSTNSHSSDPGCGGGGPVGSSGSGSGSGSGVFFLPEPLPLDLGEDPLLPFLGLPPSDFLGLPPRFGDPLFSRFSLPFSFGDLLLDSFEEDLDPFLPEPTKWMID